MVRLLQMGRPHRRLLLLAFFCMGAVGATTGAYAFLMGPALQFLLTGGTGGVHFIGRWFPGLQNLPRDQIVLAVPFVVVAIGLLKGVGYLGQFYFMGLYGQRVVSDLRRRVFERVLSLTPGQRSTLLSGDILSRFTADVAAVEQAATYTVASWMRDTLQIVILGTVAVLLSWKLSLLTLIAVPLAIIPASRLTGVLMGRVREGQAALGDLAGQVQEGLGALKTIQAFCAEALEQVRFERRTTMIRRALTVAGWSRAAVPGVMEVLASIAIAGTLSWVAATQSEAPEALVSFLGAVILLYQPAKDLGRVSQFAITASVSFERLDALLKLESRVVDRPGAGLAPSLRDAIEFRDVSFAWAAHRGALNRISVRLQAGQTTALVGESGSGKSSFIAVLLRLEDPVDGEIVIDGVDVRNYQAASVRSQMALVTQESLLFAGSIRENLIVGNPEASVDELRHACETAGAWEFVETLPRGLDTPIGERGVILSGGQRQKLALARALVGGRSILVLDEATSNLDPQSEREVQEALEQVLRGRTAIVVAHRLESIQSAEHILVMHQGRIVEEGTHTHLMALSGRYRTLWNAQQVSRSERGPKEAANEAGDGTS
jgi:subfamily B ATP-binding cassette protein MsbA